MQVPLLARCATFRYSTRATFRTLKDEEAKDKKLKKKKILNSKIQKKKKITELQPIKFWTRQYLGMPF